jgi:very-short-patch-repair endonuclease
MHQKLYDLAADGVEYMMDLHVGRHLGKLDSPLEVLFLEGLAMNHFLGGAGIPPINQAKAIGPHAVFGIKTQYKIRNYRADFLLVSWDGRAVVVECDGHDYHERTKKQAAHDRKKDREVQAAGYMILRYTGSEIWKDPLECVGNAVQTLFKATNRVPSWRVGFDLDMWMEHGDDWSRIQLENLKKANAEIKDIGERLSA